MDVSPQQIVSVATALVPFLEHNDANRALMGSNMQRQAVPLLRGRGSAHRHGHGVPLGRRHRRRAAGQDRPARCGACRPTASSSRPTRARWQSYDLLKFERSNQGTFIHQKPVVDVGDTVEPGDVLADGASTKSASWPWAATCWSPS